MKKLIVIALTVFALGFAGFSQAADEMKGGEMMESGKTEKMMQEMNTKMDKMMHMMEQMNAKMDKMENMHMGEKGGMMEEKGKMMEEKK
jgi:hypothetical protein